MSEIHLIYTSRAVASLTAAELDSLAQLAQQRNEELGITGVLLYGGGRFLQLLEGQTNAVESLYFDKIVHDKRHTECTVLYQAPCESRLLPDWHMGRLYMQEAVGSAQWAWDALCAEIGRQSPAAVFARNPATYCINQFIKHFGENLDRIAKVSA